MKAPYEAPPLEREEFRSAETIGLSTNPSLLYDDLDGWTPFKPLK